VKEGKGDGERMRERLSACDIEMHVAHHNEGRASKAEDVAVFFVFCWMRWCTCLFTFLYSG
jgi:hypothetical protein